MKSEKRDGETIGEALERMVGGYDLLDFAADAEGRTSPDVDSIETAMQDGSERSAREIHEDLDTE